MISLLICKQGIAAWQSARSATACLLFLATACGGSTATSVQPQPTSADPSTKVTSKSSSSPNRNTASTGLGHDGAEKWLKPTTTNDCELRQCEGIETQPLLDAIRAQLAETHRCYEEAFKETPNIAGRLVVAMRVTTEGLSCPIQVPENELAESQSLVPCIRKFVERSYPKPAGGCVDFQLPLRFVPEFIEADAGTAAPARAKQRQGAEGFLSTQRFGSALSPPHKNPRFR